MLHKINQDLRGKTVEARDGEIGSVADVLFDDTRWVVRYLVVDTGHWLPGRRVLISPASVSMLPPADERVLLDLSREQVRGSPDAFTDLPVARQFEEAHARHYGYPFYWNGPYLWGEMQQPVTGSPPVTAPPGGANAERTDELKQEEARARHSHLRSVEEITGYSVMARDGYAGHIDDLLMERSDWSISAALVDTAKVFSRGHVWLPVSEILEIDWIAREVRASTSGDALGQAESA